MIDKIRLRSIARAGLAICSMSFMLGALLIYVGMDILGDAMMIFGGVGLLVFALLLAKTPTGDKDAG